jgi:hypothetical protein
LGCIAGLTVYGTAIRMLLLLNGSSHGQQQLTYERILQMSPAQLHRYVHCLQAASHSADNTKHLRSPRTILKGPWREHASEIKYREGWSLTWRFTLITNCPLLSSFLRSALFSVYVFLPLSLLLFSVVFFPFSLPLFLLLVLVVLIVLVSSQ